jgi:hypothetical protein
MLKKIVSSIIAGAFATALAAPAVMACPGHDEGKVAKKADKGDTKTAQKVKAKKAPKPAKSKGVAKKVVSKG